MTSLYHILDKKPTLYKDDTEIEYEALAKQLADSGRLRIDTDYYCNFARYTDSNANINFIFSKKELTDPELIESVRTDIRLFYKAKGRSVAEQQIDHVINALQKQIKKLLDVDEELKMRLARVFVQSAHPIAIRWILHDRAQVFITYSHNIGDLMDIKSWKTSGSNSGMQSTESRRVCIYVSCGGDPFADNNENHPTYGDGWAALARMQIIAAQEIGHFADIERDIDGVYITRHSANFACTAPTKVTTDARKADLKKCKNSHQYFLPNGMLSLLKEEEKLRFYHTQKVTGLRVLGVKIMILIYRHKFLKFAKKHNLYFVQRFKKERYMGILINAMFLDMQANVDPQADVYKRGDPLAQEAISCAEALARVPQQVIKWGYLTTRAVTPELYKLYYKEVMPSLIYSYNKMNNTNYKRKFKYPYSNYSWHKKILYFMRSFLKSKNKIKLQEVRDVD